MNKPFDMAYPDSDRTIISWVEKGEWKEVPDPEAANRVYVYHPNIYHCIVPKPKVCSKSPKIDSP